MESSRIDSPIVSTKDVTTNMATAANIPQPKANFLSLPGEIRNIIYRMVLTTQYAYDPMHRRFGRLETNLLHVNRKVRTESTAILYGANIWVYVCLDAVPGAHFFFKKDVPVVSQRVPGFMKQCDTDIGPGLAGYSADRVPWVSPRGPGPIGHPTLTIGLAQWYSDNHCPPKERTSKYILARESIRFLVQFLWDVTTSTPLRLSSGAPRMVDIKNASLNLVLGTSPFHSRTQLQRICLEPFALVGTLANITIEGDIDPAVHKQLLIRMRFPFIMLESAIEVGSNHLQRGNIAQRCGDHREAFDVFDLGLTYLLHAQYSLEGYKLGKGICHQNDVQVLLSLRNILNSHWSRAVLCLGHFEIAKKRATFTLRDPGITDVDRLNLTLCKLCAQRGLDGGHDDNGLTEFVSILRQVPRACIRTYFETFPSTDEGLEAKWIHVAAGLGEDLGEAQEALMLAQDELLQCSTRYREDSASSTSNSVSLVKT
ncbi:hypothetical protein BDR22DRAFT_901260 [Usnea florida]